MVPRPACSRFRPAAAATGRSSVWSSRSALSKTALVPCVVRDPGALTSAEEDSLAENVQRVALHPLDQFRAFKTLREQGAGEEEIAARFFVTPAVVKQRLRLASVSEKLLDIYAEDGMTLEQLMAFTVTTDHARQEQVWEALQQSYNKEPYLIRRQLTESAVRASDRRARVRRGSRPMRPPAALSCATCSRTTVAAGSRTSPCSIAWPPRSWRQKPQNDRRRRLEVDRGRGRFPLWPREPSSAPPWRARRASAEEQATFDALTAEYAKLESEYEGADELPDEVDARLGEIETALAAFDNRPLRYDPAEIARAGVFVSIDADGTLAVDRGYVRPEDEPSPVDDRAAPFHRRMAREPAASRQCKRTVITVGGVEAGGRGRG